MLRFPLPLPACPQSRPALGSFRCRSGSDPGGPGAAHLCLALDSFRQAPVSLSPIVDALWTPSSPTASGLRGSLTGVLTLFPDRPPAEIEEVAIDFGGAELAEQIAWRPDDTA